MNDQEYWRVKFDKKGAKGANNFALSCFYEIKDKNFKTLLDCGCGDGRDSLYFAGKGLDVTSVDFSKSGLENLRGQILKKGIVNIQVLETDIEEINLENNSFDAIYCHLSLHYFDDETTNKIFDRLFGILKKDGRFFIKCKSIDDKLYGKGIKIGEDMYKEEHIRHFFSMDYMKEKLEKFQILKIRKTSSRYAGYKSDFIEAIATK